MRNALAALFLVVALCAAAAACSPAGQVPANYYENDLHRGYPGPAVADPKAE